MKKLALFVLLFLCTGFSFGEKGLKGSATLTSILIRVTTEDIFYCNPLNLTKTKTIEVTTDYFDQDGNLAISQSIELAPGEGSTIVYNPLETNAFYCKTTFKGRKSDIKVGAGLGTSDEMFWMVNVH